MSPTPSNLQEPYAGFLFHCDSQPKLIVVRPRPECKNEVSDSAATLPRLFQAVRPTIRERQCPMDVIEVPDGTSVPIGRLPPEHLDFVIDMKGQCLIGDRAHGGEHICES